MSYFKKKKIEDLEKRLDYLNRRIYELQIDLEYDEFYSNDLYSYEGEEEEDQEWLQKFEIERDQIRKDLFELTGKKYF